MSDVNSRDYWNRRFQTDWTTRRGPDQSRFFAHVALSLMPAWFTQALRGGATVCDWGCAMGDGTAALAAALPGARMCGVDFAAAAIERAREAHPGLEFECRDLLAEPGAAGFDVVFSSNVLEHFRSPAEVLGTLAGHASRLMAHLVPFREPLLNREPEHHAAFDWSDLLLRPLPGWRLLHAAATDTTDLPGSLWQGEQMLLVHARDAEAERLGLSLADIRLDSPAAAEQAAALASRAQRQLVAQLEAALAAQRDARADLAAQRDAMAAERAHAASLARDLQATVARLTELHAAAESSLHDLREQLARERAEVARLTQTLQAARVDLDVIRASRIWRWTAPFRRATGGS